METITLDDPHYPLELQTYLCERAPKTLDAVGNLDILEYPKAAIFASSRCPGRILDMTHDLAQALRREELTMIGGFQSPVERACFEILARSLNPLIVCLARGMATLRIRPEWRRALDEGRLLLLSPFNGDVHRATRRQATDRNAVAAALADRVIIAYAQPDSILNNLAATVAAWRKPLYTLEADDTRNLTAQGARPWNPRMPFGMP